MRLQHVYEHNLLGAHDTWATVRSRVCDLLGRSSLQTDIRSKVVQLLDDRGIGLSSVDLVRFRWREDNPVENDEDEDEGIEGVDIKVAPHRTVVVTPVTIWVGVLPDTFSSEVAYHSSLDILKLLEEYGISGRRCCVP